MRFTKKPSFARQHAKNVKRLKSGWRNPRGRTNKLRLRERSRGFLPNPGYGTPSALRGLHPSMLFEKMVSNVDDLKNTDKSRFAVRISSMVGNRKRIDIQAKAAELGLRVLNPRKVELKKPKVKEAPKEHKHETKTEHKQEKK